MCFFFKKFIWKHIKRIHCLNCELKLSHFRRLFKLCFFVKKHKISFFDVKRNSHEQSLHPTFSIYCRIKLRYPVKKNTNTHMHVVKETVKIKLTRTTTTQVNTNSKRFLQISTLLSYEWLLYHFCFSFITSMSVIYGLRPFLSATRPYEQ